MRSRPTAIEFYQYFGFDGPGPEFLLQLLVIGWYNLTPTHNVLFEDMMSRDGVMFEVADVLQSSALPSS